MKKNYTNPEMNISKFDVENILTESNGPVTLTNTVDGVSLGGNILSSQYDSIFGNQ